VRFLANYTVESFPVVFDVEIVTSSQLDTAQAGVVRHLVLHSASTDMRHATVSFKGNLEIFPGRDPLPCCIEQNLADCSLHLMLG
jgi:hypothetical protein